MSWRRLRTLLRREVIATFRDPFTVAILVSVPLVALLLFGFVLSTEVENLALGVYDADRSRSSRELVAGVTATGTFDPKPYASRERLERALRGGEISAAIVIPPEFERSFRARVPGRKPPEILAAYDDTEAVLAGNAEAFLGRLVAANLPMSPDASRAAEPAGRVTVMPQALFNPSLDGKPFMVSGTFGFVLSFLTTLITAVSIVNEKQAGTFEQLRVTPATALEILLGKLLPMGAIFSFDILLMMLVAGFVIGVWPAGSWVFFLVISSFYVLVSLSLGLIFSATSATASEAVQKTVLFSVPLIQLSGFLFPIRSMPGFVQWAVELLPATHYIRLSRAIYIRGEGPLGTAWEICLLLVFSAALIAFAVRTIEARS